MKKEKRSAFNIKPPTTTTLKKYGLSLEEWWHILEDQKCVCPICEKEPSTGRFVIDHKHVRGWKKMEPEERKKYVRGITCWFCNRYLLIRGMSIQKAENIITYLME